MWEEGVSQTRETNEIYHRAENARFQDSHVLGAGNNFSGKTESSWAVCTLGRELVLSPHLCWVGF